MNIHIGKHTLESLTMGLYLNPMDLYREYIQNSIDSIDEAYANNFLNNGDGKIEIMLDKSKRIITISDNGIGIPEKDAIQSLVDIGNSSKSLKKQRGFRGIGRLIGISCSNKVTFETTYPGENVGTKVSFDSLKMREIMVPGQYEDYDINKTLDSSLTSINFIADKDEHYFKVLLEGVHNINNILNIINVKNYLLQVAPIPYDRDLFTWGDEIEKTMISHGKPIDSYRISIKTPDTKEVILKKIYSDSFWVKLKRKTIDYLDTINIEIIKDGETNEKLALLWYTNSNFLGTIADKRIKGLRLRHGNLLIGDHSTSNRWFKEERFNGWFQGEVFILSDKIIPNARRDDFELNESYIKLSNALKIIGDSLSKNIRIASQNRSHNNTFDDLDTFLDNTDNSNKYPVLSFAKKELSKKQTMVIIFDIIYENLGEKDGSNLIDNILNKIT